MSSATERLRELLDERGEFYKTSGNKTFWGRPIDRQTGKPINIFHYQAQPMGEDRLFVELQLATPEQAIDATLGRGTCRFIDEDNYDESEGCDAYSWFRCSACGWTFDECDRWLTTMSYCPNCGRRVEVGE